MKLIISNILNQQELFTLYSEIISTPGWYLNRGSTQEQNTITSAGFCGLKLADSNNYYHPYLMGKINIILDRIKNECLRQGEVLPNKIFRVDCVAKQKNVTTKPHKDLEQKNAISIVGLLTPVWDKKSGGNFFILNDENKIIDEIEHKPGQFIVINANQIHDGKGPEVETEYWRIILNIVLF